MVRTFSWRSFITGYKTLISNVIGVVDIILHQGGITGNIFRSPVVLFFQEFTRYFFFLLSNLIWMNCKEFVWGFQTWGSLFLAKTLDWLQTCYTLTGHICNVLNASAKDCSVSRNQQHMCNNPSLLGRIRLYSIGTRTTVQYSGKLAQDYWSPRNLSTPWTQQEKYSDHNSRPSLYQTQALTLSATCFPYILLLALDWLHLIPLSLWNKKLQQSLPQLLCLLVSRITASITQLNSNYYYHS